MTSKKLESIFNFILICNLMLHSLYLASSIATEIYKVFGQTSYTAHVIFASFLLAFKVRVITPAVAFRETEPCSLSPKGETVSLGHEDKSLLY